MTQRHRFICRLSGLLFSVLLLLVVIFQDVSLGKSLMRQASGHPAAMGSQSKIPVSTSLAQPAIRRIYPYSIIPGGAASPRELKQIVENNPALVPYLNGFDSNNAKLIQLAAPRSMYVSYRRHNLVYWTKNPVTLPTGEQLLTDGTHTIRTRCGNEVSAQRIGPTSASEPSAQEMNTLVPVLTAVAYKTSESESFNTLPELGNGTFEDDVATSSTRVISASGASSIISSESPSGSPSRMASNSPLTFPSGAGSTSLPPYFTTAPNSTPSSGVSVIAVPEPSTWTLVLLGLMAIVVWKLTSPRARPKT